MKDWKTWAIIVLSAWCAVLTYHTVKSYIDEIDRKHRHEEWERTEGAKIQRENEMILSRTKEHGRMFLEKMKMDRPEAYAAMTNRLFKSDPERFRRVFKDAE